MGGKRGTVLPDDVVGLTNLSKGSVDSDWMGMKPSSSRGSRGICGRFMGNQPSIMGWWFGTFFHSFPYIGNHHPI